MPLRWLRKARLLKLRTTTKATIAEDTNEDHRAPHITNEVVSGSLPTPTFVPTRVAQPFTNAFHDTPQDALRVIRAGNPTITSSPAMVEAVVPEYTHGDGASGDPRSYHNDSAEDAPPTPLVAMTVSSAFTIWLKRALHLSLRDKKRKVPTAGDAKKSDLEQTTDRPNAVVIVTSPTQAAQLSRNDPFIVDSPHAPVTDDEPVRQATAPPTSPAPTSPPSATQVAGDTSSLPSIPDTRFPGVRSNNEGSERTSPSRKKPPTIHISTATNDISLSTFSLLRRSRPGVEAAPRGWPSHMPTELVGMSPTHLDLCVNASTQNTAPMLWLEESALCESPSSMSPAEPESSAEESVPYLDLGQREVQPGGDQAHSPAYDASAGIDHPDPSPQHVASPTSPKENLIPYDCPASPLSYLRSFHSILDPVRLVGVSFVLGEHVFTVEGWVARLRDYTIFLAHSASARRYLWLKVICKSEFYCRGNWDRRAALLLDKEILRRVYVERRPGLERSLKSWSDDCFVYHWIDEYVETLQTLIDNSPLQDFMFNRYAAELLLALFSLHDMGYIHRTIDTNNILVRRDGSLALTNFAQACFYDPASPPRESVGSLGFTAPEAIAPGVFGPGDGGYDQRVDVWSLGVVFLQMYTRSKHRVYAGTAAQVEYETFRCDPLTLPGMTYVYHHDRVLHDLLSKMLVRDPSRRATARELLSHQYFKIIDVDWNDLDRSFPKPRVITSIPRYYGLEKAEPKAWRVTAAAQALLDYERKERLQKGDPYSFSPEKYHAWD